MNPLLAALLLFCSTAATAVEVREFDDPEKQARYERLIEELRCLVCQNQSLADSDADLAKDLRDEVYGIIQKGQNEAEAIRFLTERYGDFVLYRPPFKPITLLLWGAPPVILFAGGAFIWTQNRRRATTASTADLSSSEKERLESLKKTVDQGH